MEFKGILQKLTGRQDLTKEEAAFVLREIMEGRTSSAQIACFLTALRMKGETVDEITALASVMREKAVSISPRVDMLVDTCGTGGDYTGTFNISTAAAFIAAGAGVSIAKHGNRSVSSKCGSADVMEKLGVNITLPPEKVEKVIEGVGIGFLFAPIFHPAMKAVLPTRKEMGIKTVFNILGPLTNPASAQAQVLGAYNPQLIDPLIRVLRNLGTKAALVVHGSGLDELATTGETEIAELKAGGITKGKVKPEDFGFERTTIDRLKGSTVEHNAEIILGILNGKKGPCRDIALLNAGAVIYVGGKAPSIADGIMIAEDVVDSGKAYQKQQELIRATKVA